MRLADFERDGAAFCSALNRERYLQGAGLKPDLELTPIYDRFRRLFDLETFHDTRALPLDEPLGDKYRSFLLALVAANYLQNGVKTYSEAIARAESSTTIPWGERELS